MYSFTDDLDQTYEFDEIPNRVISLCPSLTETLFDLGVGHKVICVTDFCLYPATDIKNLPKIGGPKSLDIETIEDLNPDLLIAIKEENSKEQIEYLKQTYKVVVFDIECFDESLQMILGLGCIFKEEGVAKQIILDIRDGFDNIIQNKSNLKALYLVWKNPWMAAGINTYIDSILSKVGFENIVDDKRSRYPEVDINNCNADVVFLPSEPYNFSEDDKMYVEQLNVANRVLLVDGEMFCWYGSHMLKAVQYFQKLLCWI